MIYSSPVDGIDQQAPVTTTFDPKDEADEVEVTHETERPPLQSTPRVPQARTP